VKHTVYPPADEVFAWTRMTDINDVSCRIVVFFMCLSLDR